jgi:hypothetical protein
MNRLSDDETLRSNRLGAKQINVFAVNQQFLERREIRVAAAGERRKGHDFRGIP